jgi:hypothetical protein
VGEYQVVRGVLRVKAGTVAVLAATLLVLPLTGSWRAAAQGSESILERNMDVSRRAAADRPRSEGDQAVVGGWPLYRTDRGQAAYNAMMATLAATDFKAPTATAFKGCGDLQCELELPRVGSDGWLPAGRLWLSPSEYVLIVHSPRPRTRGGERLRSYRSMRYFVFHEFHNSSHNTDTFDTISSHSGRVFVPFYLSKSGVDARGRRYATIVQVAPYNVVSVHATNYGSAGPGVEVAKNMSDDLEALQLRAGIVLAAMVKRAAPHLRVVNHRGREGLAMLDGYEARLAALRRGRAQGPVVLPFYAAQPAHIAAVRAELTDLILAPGKSRRLAVAERAFVPPRDRIEAPAEAAPTLVGPVRAATRPAHAPRLVEPVQLIRQSAFSGTLGQ